MMMGISSAQHCLNTPRVLVRIGFKLPEIVCRIIYIRMHFEIFRKLQARISYVHARSRTPVYTAPRTFPAAALCP